MALQQLLRIPWVYDGAVAGAAYGGSIFWNGEKLRMPLIRPQKAASDMDGTITVETDLFEHREVKPHFINPCCFGEDFAGWLKEQLSPLVDAGFNFSKIIQEDYGWGFWAWHSKDPFWVALSYVGDGPQEAPAQWIISVSYDPGLNLVKRLFHKPDRQALQNLRDHVRQAVTSNTAITIVPAPHYGP